MNDSSGPRLQASHSNISPTRRRIAALVDQAPAVEPWLGRFTQADLEAWLKNDLGAVDALDAWIPRGPIHSRAVALSPALHIISSNTPHAGFQSLLRGLLIGGRQRVKLPSTGLPELESWISNLPPILAALVETSHVLPKAWKDSAVAIVFGDAATMDFFREWCLPATRLIEHGPKLSVAVLFSEPEANTLAALAEDVLREDQRGCLSVQNILCDATTIDTPAFARKLAIALEAARAGAFPCRSRTISESGAIRNFRETLRYRAANGEPITIHESKATTAWTVVVDATHAPALLSTTPGGGTVIVKSFTSHPTTPRKSIADSSCSPPKLNAATLGPEFHYLSTVVCHPFDDSNAISILTELAPPRLCAPGMAQFPSLFWSHDGQRPLADLVRWCDLG